MYHSLPVFWAIENPHCSHLPAVVGFGCNKSAVCSPVCDSTSPVVSFNATVIRERPRLMMHHLRTRWVKYFSPPVQKKLEHILVDFLNPDSFRRSRERTQVINMYRFPLSAPALKFNFGRVSFYPLS